MKNRLIYIVTSVLFWALLITAVAAWFINSHFQKYEIEIVKTESANNSKVYFSDIDNDSLSERIEFRYKKDYKKVAVFKHDNQLIFDQPLVGYFPQNFQGYYIEDIDNDGIKEISFITQQADSSFINTLKLNTQLRPQFSQKFVSKIHKNFKDQYDFGGYFLRNKANTNNTQFNKIYFFFAAGYSYFPRKIFVYDFKNDTIYGTPTNGIYCTRMRMYDTKPDNNTLIYCSSFAVNNYEPEFSTISYPDTSAWLTVFNTQLQYQFQPIELRGKGSFYDINHIVINDSSYIVATVGNFKTNDNLKLQLFSTQGKWIKNIDIFNLKFSDIIFKDGFFPDNNENMLFTDKKNNTYFINNELEVEKRKIEFSQNELCISHLIFDLDSDGKPEKIFVGSREIVVYQNDFDFACRLSISNADFISASYYKSKSESLVCLQNDELLHFISYHKNPTYFLNYVSIAGVFLLVLSFLFLFQRVRTYQLKKENIRLNEIITKRTEEIVTKNEILNHQKDEIEAQTEFQKELIDKLQKLDDYKQSLSAMIVHDLKNPLNYIINQNHHQKTAQLGRQMLTMVMNILDIQKFEDTKMNLNSENQFINDTLRNAVKQIEYLLEEKNLVLMNYLNTQIQLAIDNQLIERVFVNLLTNAIKYSPQNGKITIKSEICANHSNLPDFENLADFRADCKDFVKISITDNGAGIPNDFIPKIFDKFSQAEAKNLGFSQSTGLGLTFCKYAVEAHGGTIGVESIEQQGSTFWFTLPDLFRNHSNQTATDVRLVDRNLINLSETDKEYLLTFAEKLKKTKLYEISELNQLLKQIDQTTSDNIHTWKQEIQKAVLNFNEIEFQNLVNRIYE